jgi:pimeloyl-ACP methyl ester carboxylesterase
MVTWIRLVLAFCIVLPLTVPATALSQSICDPDGVQDSGSIYRICMPPAGEYNGNLVIWAHGFQDAGTPVEIPENQLCIDGFCIPELINGLGFGFATNSYSKTGLAIRQGMDDIVDLVDIFAAEKGTPAKVYLVGASEGGIITALLVEGRPDVFDAGVAACGPVGDFPFQINYFGNGRALFQYFFPGVIPGDPFDPAPLLVENWSAYYEQVVRPVVLNPANRDRLDQLVVVAKLPFDPDNYLETAEQSVRDVLRYSVVNLKDASETLGGFPFDNRTRFYRGSDNDLLLNLLVPRVDADPEAITEMETFYNTSGALQQELVTMHTRLDQQVPYLHEPLYILKTIASGSYLTRHVNVPIDRYGHCNFTPGELVFSFALMLAYDGSLVELTGLDSFLEGGDLEAFQRRADAATLPYRLEGPELAATLGE